MSNSINTLNELFKEAYADKFLRMFCNEESQCLDIECTHSWCIEYHVKQKELKKYNDNFIGHLKDE